MEEETHLLCRTLYAIGMGLFYRKIVHIAKYAKIR